MRTTPPPRLRLIRSVSILLLQLSPPACNLLHILHLHCLKWPSTRTRTKTTRHIPSYLTFRPPPIAALPHPPPPLPLLAIGSKTGRLPVTSICRKRSVDIPISYSALHSPTMGNSSLLVQEIAHSECGTERPDRPFLVH